ncbi:M23 family metallopeptidase [Paracoccus sp. (in: a-proteobacteria)]|uniref:M23 family metallopeptidase n=1 Tax=Paracoccus sp. TaxID=267 RepID=UPI0032206E0E
MTVPLMLLQIGLPAALLVWLAAFPASGAAAFMVQACATAAVLVALGLVAPWVMPPWWVPWLFGLAFAAIVGWLRASGRLQGRDRRPQGWPATVALILLAALGVFSTWLSTQALAGRRLPEAGTVNIKSPFSEGSFIVAHGGSTATVNAHLRTFDPTVERYRRWRGQSLAVDLIRITPMGFRTDGWRPADPARYAGFGTPIMAPCDGRVVVASDGLPDMQVPATDLDHLAGNFILIDCGGFVVALAHLRQGSVLPEEGDRVQTGDPIGELGNSGNSSEPHLHIHAQRGIPPDAPFGGEPLGLTIDGRFPVRNDRLRAAGQ